MPTVSEDWHWQKAKQDAMVEDFILGNDSTDVLSARLFGLGLRGDYLKAEVRQADERREEHREAARRYWRPTTFRVIVFERGRKSQIIRFISEDAASNAINLLRKQPDVQLAVRTRIYATG